MHRKSCLKTKFRPIKPFQSRVIDKSIPNLVYGPYKLYDIMDIIKIYIEL